ncbi:MAG: 2-amino-4-hydroxy-6-hydroxymethyldihydropteridine diphosphokinase, partial [Paramuribaculum sp.]|nr:2-amino-4-hydroxy-6-hydroxymethyldihydropteridine diphosphokinase [Paramuribaculum sp.]
MHTAYINIGSNLGDRHGNIAAAVAAVRSRINPVVRLSDPVESTPWGYDSPNGYINIGVAFDTPLNPNILLDTLLDIEKNISPLSHRTHAGEYADRIIDIDLIAIDDMVMDTPTLTLPHPRMHLRPFVLIPMRQLAPAWIHPRLH